MTQARREMIQALVTEQNRIALAGVPIDILTITGFMTDAEVEAHLERYRAYVPQARPARASKCSRIDRAKAAWAAEILAA